MCLSNKNVIRISKNRASKLGLGVIILTSASLLVYTFSKKSKKIKKVKIFLFKNKKYLYKFLVILTVFFPNFLSYTFLFSKKKISYFLELFDILVLNLINLNFLYVLGLLFFQILWIPFFKISFFFYNIFLNFFNFLNKIKVFNTLIFFEIALQLFIIYWTTFGFFVGFFNDISSFSKVKILLLDFLAFFTATIILVVTFIFNKKETRFIKLNLFHKNFDFFRYLKKLKKYIYTLFLIKLLEFNKIENIDLKFNFLLVEIINVFYAITLFFLRIKWLFQLIKFLRTFYYCRPI